jgi:hypothetical protein
MAKRGRPPKPKIETVRNRVGRPNRPNDGATYDKFRLMAEWDLIERKMPLLPKERRKQILADVFCCSREKVEKAVTDYNRLKKNGMQTFLNDNGSLVFVSGKDIFRGKFAYLRGQNPLNGTTLIELTPDKTVRVISL